MSFGDDRAMPDAKILDVFVWSSFACNNSSDYRLVAEFESPKAAAAMRAELVKFFKTHAKQHDAADLDWPGEPTPAAHALGEKYGHRWKEFLIWGDEQLEGDEPEVGVVGNTLVLYHGYSSGGFGPDVPRILQKAGARLTEKGAEDGPPVLHGSFELGNAKLEKELTTFFDQRNGNANRLSDWTWPKWATAGGAGKAEDVSFVIADGRCTFTLPLAAENIAPFQKYLAPAKKLELRLATKSDVSRNKKRDEELAAEAVKNGAEVKPFLAQTSQASAKKRGKVGVTTLFDYDGKINGADDIVVAGDEIIAFAGDKKKTQRLVVRGGKTRTVTNLSCPKAWLQGTLVEADGSWRTGGEQGRIYVSTDTGKTWKEEKHPGLGAALGHANRIWSLCRFQGALWAAGEGGVARQHNGKWTAVPVPAAVKAKKPGMYDTNVFLPRLVVVEDTLFVLGFGIARWDGKKLAVELEGKHNVETLTVTEQGTLLAAGKSRVNPKTGRVEASRTVWRKPRGGSWAMLDEKAIDVGTLSKDDIERKISYGETFKSILCTDGLVFLIGENERPGSQMNAARVSEDDGQTFRRLRIDLKGYLNVTCATVDGRGGVLMAGQGGVLLRISRDGLGDWSTQAAAKAAPAKTTAKAPAKTTAAPAKGKARRFELVEGSSSKFWEISLDGSSFTTRFGRIGASGQSSTKSFDSADKARKEYDKLVAEKTRKGYTEK